MTDITEPKSERVDLRMTPTAKRTLQRAAAVSNKTVSEFLLDSSLSAAFDENAHAFSPFQTVSTNEYDLSIPGPARPGWLRCNRWQFRLAKFY
jgi:hypothetical protein